MQRMIVMPPEIFNKFKDLIENDKNLNILDQKMKNVLYNKKLKPLQKWHLYRQNLIKYGINRRSAKKLPEKSPSFGKSFDATTQTKFVSKRNAHTETISPKYQTANTQTNFIPFVEDDVFEYNPKKEQRDASFNFSDFDDDEEDWDIDKKLAQAEINKDTKLIERPSLNSDFRIFETKEGDVITVAAPSQSPKKPNLRSAGAKISPSILSRFPNIKKRKQDESLHRTPKRTLSVPAWKTYK